MAESGNVNANAIQKSGQSSRLTIHVVLAKISHGTGETVLEASKDEVQSDRQPIRVKRVACGPLATGAKRRQCYQQEVSWGES